MDATETQRLIQLNQSRVKTKIKKIKKAPIKISFVELFIVLGAAATLDILDVIALTGFGAVIVILIDVPTTLAIWLWVALKGEKIKIKNSWLKIGGSFLLEISPFGIIPTWTTLILYIWYKNRKNAS
jgi:hypothetical protein